MAEVVKLGDGLLKANSATHECTQCKTLSAFAWTDLCFDLYDGEWMVHCPMCGLRLSVSEWWPKDGWQSEPGDE